ncbi:unnamed protein product [Closterium sp. NIES-54]
MASWKSTGTYVDEVPPPGANIVSGMWIFRVKRPPGSPPAFKARYVARGFSQRQGVDFFQTFSPTPKMTTLRVLLHVAAQRDYELHSLDFSTAFLQGSLHEEIRLRRPPSFTGSFPAGTQWSLQRPVYGLCQAPREWHDTLRMTLAALGFAPSTSDPSLLLGTNTTLPPFYVLVAQRTITLTQSHMVHQVLQRFGFTYSSPQSTPLPTGHSLSAPPSDESVEPSGPYPELMGCLMYLMTCTRPDLAYPLSLLARYMAPGRHRKVHWDAAKKVLRYLCSTSGMGLVLGGRAPFVLTGHADASWVGDLATQRSSQGYTFSLGSSSVSWRSTLSYSVLSSSWEAEIYAGAMAAQELRWLTYLLTDLGEAPRSPPVLNLARVDRFQDLGITTTFPGHKWFAASTHVTTGAPLAAFSHENALGLFMLRTASPGVAAAGQIDASWLCWLLNHPSLLWLHCLGHPALPHLRHMAQHCLVSGLPASFPPLPHSFAPPCTPCVGGRQRGASHSSSLTPSIEPLQTLHMDV